VLVGYGSVESPLHEDRWQCLESVRERGGDDTALAEADRLVSAAHALLRSKLQNGWSEFEARVRDYGKRPWLQTLAAERCIAAGFAAYPAWIIRRFAGARLPPGIDWDYDSHAVLTRLPIPMLWLLAEQDREAPVVDTVAALKRLAEAGKPVKTLVFPGTDHGMVTFRVEQGARVKLGYHPDYFRYMLDFWRTQFDLPALPKKK